MTGFKVCRFRDLVKGDQFLDPGSGALVRVDAVEQVPQRSGPLKITVSMTYVSAKNIAKLTLRHDRPMRRKLREGEQA